MIKGQRLAKLFVSAKRLVRRNNLKEGCNITTDTLDNTIKTLKTLIDDVGIFETMDCLQALCSSKGDLRQGVVYPVVAIALEGAILQVRRQCIPDPAPVDPASHPEPDTQVCQSCHREFSRKELDAVLYKGETLSVCFACEVHLNHEPHDPQNHKPTHQCNLCGRDFPESDLKMIEMRPRYGPRMACAECQAEGKS